MADIATIKAFMTLTEALLQYAQKDGVANPSATSNQQMQGLFQNWSDTIFMMVQSFWQPNRQYVLNDTCQSPSMPANTIAICTKAGTSGSSEPTWPSLINGTVTDNGVTWKLIEAYPQQLPANGGTADTASNALKLNGQAASYYATAANLALKAAIASPTFTGTPKAPTAAAGTNNTQIATTAFVANAIAAISSQGKITAYNLAQNGYVKWDIGLILQWGKISNVPTGNAATFSFPLAISTLLCAAAVGSSPRGDILSHIGISQASSSAASVQGRGISNVNSNTFIDVGSCWLLFLCK